MPPGFPGASLRFVPTLYTRKILRRRRLAKLLPFLVCRPGFGSDWLQPAPGALANLPAELRPVLIVVFRLYLHDAARPVLARFPRARTALDLDDFESRTRRSIAGALWRLRRWRAGMHEWALSLQYAIAERTLMRRYHTPYLAAPTDRAALAATSRADVAVFPNRLSPPPPLPSLPPTRLLFVGALDYPPNQLAALWLMKMVPLLRARLPQLVPTIVGRRAAPVLRQRLARCEGLEFIDDAPDLSPCYAAALAVLVPLEAGGGTKFKTIEAFAYGRPVISTPEGVRGLGALAGRDYLKATTTAGFIDAAARLAADPQLAQRLGAAGRRLWQEGFAL